MAPNAFAASLTLLFVLQAVAATQGPTEGLSGIYENRTIRRFYRVQFDRTIGLNQRSFWFMEEYVDQQIRRLVAETQKDTSEIRAHLAEAVKAWADAQTSSTGSSERRQKCDQELAQLEKCAAKLHHRLKYVFAAMRAEDREFRNRPGRPQRLDLELEALALEISSAEKQIYATLSGNSVVGLSGVNDNMLLSLDRVQQIARLAQKAPEK